MRKRLICWLMSGRSMHWDTFPLSSVGMILANRFVGYALFDGGEIFGKLTLRTRST